MKIYISADIEGISGIVNWNFTFQEGYEYTRGRKLMTEEVNAAVKGAKLAGATEILVNDSHGPMTNILIEELDEDVKLISGNKKYLGMMEGINESFDAVMLIGYHARHNTSGVLAHTYSGQIIQEVKINGATVGEFEFNTMVAGHYGVPVIFVSGDDIISKQVKEFNESIETLVVKYAHSRYTAECIQPKKVHKLMEKAVYETIINKPQSIRPYKLKGDVELEIAFMNSGLCEAAMFMPGAEMIAPNRVRYIAKDIVEAYKVRTAFTLLASNWLK